jgi:hypothetical protein
MINIGNDPKSNRALFREKGEGEKPAGANIYFFIIDFIKSCKSLT